MGASNVDFNNVSITMPKATWFYFGLKDFNRDQKHFVQRRTVATVTFGDLPEAKKAAFLIHTLLVQGVEIHVEFVSYSIWSLVTDMQNWVGFAINGHFISWIL